jgi:hypothetical protein
MTRKLKVLGLSLVALAVIGAMSAASASAVTDKVTTGLSPALLTGVSHNNVFKNDPGIENFTAEFKCTTSSFAATVTTGASEVAAHVEYRGTLNQTPHEVHCNADPAGTVTVDMNGCNYVVNGATNFEFDGLVSIACTGGNQITITSSLGITLSVPPQSPTKGGVSFTNVASHTGNSAVKVTATATGITTTCAPAFSCGLAKIPTHSNAYEYIGDVTMTAFKDTDGLPTPVTEGERVSLSTS